MELGRGRELGRLEELVSDGGIGVLRLVHGGGITEGVAERG